MKNALKTSFRLTVSQVFSLGEGNLIFCCMDSQEILAVLIVFAL